METILIVSAILVVLGWIGGTVGIGFAVSAVAVPLAGWIVAIAFVLLTVLFMILDLQGCSQGCLTLGIWFIWVMVEVWACAFLLATAMTITLAWFLAVVIAIVWLALLAVVFSLIK